VWQPRWLSHRNGALGLASIVIAVADVDEAAARFARFTGREATPTGTGRMVQLDRGRIDLVRPEAFTKALPEVAISSLPFMGAYGVTVRSLAAADDVLRTGGIPLRRAGDCLIAPFPDELGRGAWIFAESAQLQMFR
jgi:hypothetical protein